MKKFLMICFLVALALSLTMVFVACDAVNVTVSTPDNVGGAIAQFVDVQAGQQAQPAPAPEDTASVDDAALASADECNSGAVIDQIDATVEAASSSIAMDADEQALPDDIVAEQAVEAEPAVQENAQEETARPETAVAQPEPDQCDELPVSVQSQTEQAPESAELPVQEPQSVELPVQEPQSVELPVQEPTPEKELVQDAIDVRPTEAVASTPAQEEETVTVPDDVSAVVPSEVPAEVELPQEAVDTLQQQDVLTQPKQPVQVEAEQPIVPESFAAEQSAVIEQPEPQPVQVETEQPVVADQSEPQPAQSVQPETKPQEEFVFRRNEIVPRQSDDDPTYGLQSTYYSRNGYVVVQYYLGSVNHVLLHEYYNMIYTGRQIDSSITITNINEESYMRTVEQTAVRNVSYQQMASTTASVNLRLGADSWPVAASMGIESTVSAGIESTFTDSFAETYQTAYRRALEMSQTMSPNIGADDPYGYYKLALYGDFEIYGIYAYNVVTSEQYFDTRSYLINQSIYLDYDRTGRFRVNPGEPLRWDDEALAYLESEVAAELDKYVFTVDYDLDGGQFAGPVKITYYYDGTDHSLPMPTKTGFVFAGWYDEDGQYRSKLSSAHCRDIMLVAHWVDETMVLEFDVFADVRFSFATINDWGREVSSAYKTYAVSPELRDAIADGRIGVHIKALFECGVQSSGNTTTWASADIVVDGARQWACTASAVGTYFLWMPMPGSCSNSANWITIDKALSDDVIHIGAVFYFNSNQAEKNSSNEISKKVAYWCHGIRITYYNIY